MNILLKNVHWYAEDIEGRGDIRIERGRIRAIGYGLRPGRGEQVLNLAGYIVFPGLINAHDHLGLDLFPRRGNPPYTNFYQWARDIYNPDDAVQREIMSVDLRDRHLWGGYKNLVGGVTTVVHHDPYARAVFTRRFPVDVLRRYSWVHSLGYGEHIMPKAYWSRFRGRPFVLHAAEGTDRSSQQEIDRLHTMGLLASNTVLVHAVALEPRHVDLLATAGCSTVWCPASNHFLYGATSPVAALRYAGVPVALGTDSTLSGSPTLLHEIRMAHASEMAMADELFRMVTADAARIFRLTDGQGSLREGGRADISVFPDTSVSPAEALIDGGPSLVLVRGHIRLAQSDISAQLELESSDFRMRGQSTWLCGDVTELMRRIRTRVRTETLEQNPLWRMPIFAGHADHTDHPDHTDHADHMHQADHAGQASTHKPHAPAIS